MTRPITLSGTQINNFTLLEDAPNATVRVRVSCKCGREFLRSLLEIENHKQCRSCAAKLRSTTHGMSKTSTYKIWWGIHSRCNDKNNEYYGGRGVTVCERWSGEDGFIHFLEDMGERPGPDYEIDKDKKGGIGCKLYSPDNCMWMKQEENKRYMRRGKPFSQETRKKLSLVRMNKPGRSESLWVLTSPDNIVYATHHITLFCREHNISHGAIIKAAKRGHVTNSGWSAERHLK